MTVQDWASKDVSPDTGVPLGKGPPTMDELREHYPPKFTWSQLKTFINSGDLRLLKRHKKLQMRYSAWSKGIKEQYGSMEAYLLNYRLQWGKPDRLSILRPLVADDETTVNGIDHLQPSVEYFGPNTPPHLISIILNDWPYCVPPEIEHSVVWTRQPIFHPEIIAEAIADRVERDGLCGFTGISSPPPSPSNVSTCLPAFAEWNITPDSYTPREKASDEEQELIRHAGRGVNDFVRTKWPEQVYETAWFVNPPPLQSVRGLAHIHVFARRKTEEEITKL